MALGDHGVIGDGHTCALVGLDGSIDWMCLPRFDSPSAFARLLDAENGGCFRISPAAPRFESLQAYDDVTNVLQTLFRTDTGAAVLTDFMPWRDDPRSSIHEVHRLLEVRGGQVEMQIVFDPRCDYARGETHIELAEHGAHATGPQGEQISLSAGPDVRFERRSGGGVVARFSARPGQRVWTVLSWRSLRPEPVAAYRPFEHMRSTRSFWRQWASRLDYDGPWRHDVMRSALTLKLFQYAPSGAMVAAPTTSLPVTYGGDRNWDYRYSWARDAAMATRAMSLIGYDDEALGYFHFLRDQIDHRGQLDLMVAIDGADVPEEVILSHLAGHRNSSPVRLGNAARGQVQLDILGAVLDAAWLYERLGGTVSIRLWRQLRELADEAAKLRHEPDHGIWEPRSAPSHHVHSKLMIWVALDRALRLAPRFGGDVEATAWRRTAEAVRDDILTRGFDTASGSFVGDYGGNRMDATLLLMPQYGFLPANDPRVERTLERVRRELGSGSFLRRYQGGDGIDHDEGAFVLCGFWLAEALALAGRIDEAVDVFNAHVSAANHVGLLAEEVDPTSAAPLGNFPQAFSHLGLIGAAARIDLALRVRDEGAERQPRHAIDPFGPEPGAR